MIRQATLIAPITERLFRAAGIGPGLRVLNLGSGLGDVSMAVARLVGPSGEIVGIERDATSIARAKARVAAMGFRNVARKDFARYSECGRAQHDIGVSPGSVKSFSNLLSLRSPALGAHTLPQAE